MPNLFATLGPLKLALYVAPTSWSETAETALVEHKVAEGKPVLEWVGDELRKVDLDIALNEFYCDPPAVAKQLEEMRASRKGWPLIRGNGQPDGEWAIKSIKTKIERADREGVATSLVLTLALVESPPRPEANRVSRPAVGRPAPSAPRVAAPTTRTETIVNPDGVSFGKIMR
jgi:phage protein U